MENAPSFATLPISRPSDAIAMRSELGVLLSRMSGLLSLDDGPAHGLDTNTDTDTDTEVALRLALIAMTEAEKRIERQEHRIAHLESLSVTDELTGLMNRRGFLAQLHKALALAVRGDGGGTVVMLDLDRFKAVNDTHGHAAGDALLQTVADCLRLRIRETDTICRLGGDEFAILMAGIAPAIADRRVDALKAALNALALEWDGTHIPVNASIGRADYHGGDDEKSILDRADKAMYLAKPKTTGQEFGR